jgi:catechol 2,3-dioxygenase-like lactoylglutathione lyase family enzyme
MIKGLHGMLYSSDAEATRTFLRDKLRLPCSDVGGGWLIFDVPEADLGVHPTESAPGEPAPGTHDVSFYCDDIQATVAELRGRGVTFLDEITDQGYGLSTHLELPGGVRMQIYQPLYRKGG